MVDVTDSMGARRMNTLQQIVTNNWFLLFSGLASIISFFMALFAVNKVIKIDKSVHQKQSGKNNKQAGRDNN